MQTIKKLLLIALFSLGIYNSIYPLLLEENNHLLEFIEELYAINQYKTQQIAEWLEYLTFYPKYRDRYHWSLLYGNSPIYGYKATETLRCALTIIDNPALTAKSKINFLNRLMKADKKEYAQEKRIHIKNINDGRWYQRACIFGMSVSLSFFTFLGFMSYICEQRKIQNKGF